MLFEKLADVIMKHAKLIICIWIVLLIVSIPFAYKVLVKPEDVLEYDMTTMIDDDSESVKGLRIVADSNYFYQNEVDTQLLLVIECSTAEDVAKANTVFTPAFITKMNEHYGEGKSTVSSMGLQSKTGAAPGIVLLTVGFNDDRNVSAETNPVRGIVSECKTAEYSPTTYVTGNMAITQDTLDSSMEDIKKIDPFSVLLVLILIGLFFRSLISSATPPVTIGFAYAALMVFIYGLAQFMQIYYVTSTIVLVSMLGAGCDYCIFIIARYREERKDGKDKEDALRESIIWAGESITTSGLSVIIGFGVISFCSFSMVSTMGMVLAVGVLFALIAALTLIPSILMVVGDRIFYPSTMETYADDSKTMQGWYGKMSRLGKSYFKKSAHISIKYAWVFVVVVILLTIPLAYVTMTEKTSYDTISIMPDCESKEGVYAIVDNANGGLMMPTYVLLETKGQIATINHTAIPTGDPDNPYLGTLAWVGGNDAAQIYFGATTFIQTQLTPAPAENSLPYFIMQYSTDNIASVTGVISSKILLDYGMIDVLTKAYPSLKVPVQTILSLPISEETRIQALDYLLNYNLGSISDYYDGRQYIKVTVTVRDQPMSEKSMGTIDDIRKGTADFMNTDAAKAALSASIVTGTVVATDEISEIVNSEFIWIEIAVVVLIFILLFFVMKSYLTPVRSLVTIIMSVVWTLGITHLLFGHLMGIPITWIVPIILFVICLGLGMDYDILLTTRIKENVKKGMANDDAIVHAVEKSGAVITICGLIMGGAFLTMALSNSPMLKEFGFALGFAILVDALFIRTYVVPAVMHLMGKWNWIGPRFLTGKREE